MSCFAGQQQQCSVDNLPEFGDTPDRDSPDRDRFQAIVPAYTFQCSGRVTEWRACVQPGGSASYQYYIQFQVWRPTANGVDGCYELVDYNIPLDDARVEEMNITDSTSIIEAEGFLSPPGDIGPLHRCVVLPVRESQQIEFQPGDVVGYYVDYFRDGIDPTFGGIQWISSTAVTVYYTENIARVDIKTHYALSGPNPSSCGFQVADETSNLHSLTQSATSAPIISLSFCESNALPIYSYIIWPVSVCMCSYCDAVIDSGSSAHLHIPSTWTSSDLYLHIPSTWTSSDLLHTHYHLKSSHDNPALCPPSCYPP